MILFDHSVENLVNRMIFYITFSMMNKMIKLRGRFNEVHHLIRSASRR